jgi:hypothetical protein
MSGPRENEVTGDWRILRNEEIYALCYSPSISGSRENEVTGDWRRIRNEELYVLCYSTSISGSRESEVTGDWRRLRDEELYALCYSPNKMWVIKSGTMRWAGHVARMGTEEMHAGFWW